MKDVIANVLANSDRPLTIAEIKEIAVASNPVLASREFRTPCTDESNPNYSQVIGHPRIMRVGNGQYRATTANDMIPAFPPPVPRGPNTASHITPVAPVHITTLEELEAEATAAIEAVEAARAKVARETALARFASLTPEAQQALLNAATTPVTESMDANVA